MNEQDRFERCLAEVLKHEGGYVDSKYDNGGATNLGVTINTLSACLGRKATKADVKALTPEKVAPIYHANYWMTSGASDCPAGVDLMVFDAAVNCGPGRAVKWLQTALQVTPDGKIGPKTKAAMSKADHLTIMRLAEIREGYYRALDDFSHFGKGWLNRLNAVEDLAVRWEAETE